MKNAMFAATAALAFFGYWLVGDKLPSGWPQVGALCGLAGLWLGTNRFFTAKLPAGWRWPSRKEAPGGRSD